MTFPTFSRLVVFSAALAGWLLFSISGCNPQADSQKKSDTDSSDTDHDHEHGDHGHQHHEDQDANSGDTLPSPPALDDLEVNPSEDQANQKLPPIEVPNGTVEQLKEFISEVQKRRFQGDSSQQYLEHLQQVATACHTAAQRILDKDSGLENDRFAVSVLLHTLLDLQVMKAEQAAEQFTQAVERFSADPRPEIRKTASEAKLLAGMLEMGEADKERQEKYLANLKAYFKENKVDDDNFPVVRNIYSISQSLEDQSLRSQLLAVLAGALGESDDPQFAEASEQMLSESRRLGLIGNPIKIEGTTLDGKKFDWNSYRGKVVLVDFWATWCGPCLAQLPHILHNYRRYHDKGFDVVGISLDERMEHLSAFLDEEPLPWPILFEAGNDAIGFENPVARYYGINSIPTAFLIDKQGNVVSLSAIGPELDEHLQRLLGDPIEPQTDDSGSPKNKTDIPPLPLVGRPPEPAVEAATSDKTNDSDNQDVKTSLPPLPATGRPPEPAVGDADESPSAEQTPNQANSSDPQEKQTELAVAKTASAEKPEKKEIRPRKTNPYGVDPRLSPQETLAEIKKLLDKPKSIQRRNGFSEAILAAADTVITRSNDPDLIEEALVYKMETLHKLGLSGDQQADIQLAEIAKQHQDSNRDAIASCAQFYALERQALDADELPKDILGKLLERLDEFFAKTPLDERHLRMASATVRVINRLPSDEEAGKAYKKFGGYFSKSEHKRLASYGKKISKGAK